MAKANPQPAVDDDDIPEGDVPDGGRTKRTIPFDRASMPAGVRAVLKLKPWRDVENFKAYIYRLVPDPEKKGKENSINVDKVYNTDIDEAYLREHFAKPYVQKFRVMYQVPNPVKGGDVELYTDDFFIDAVDKVPAVVAPGGATAPTLAPAGVGDPLEMMERLARIMVVLRDGQGAAAGVPAWFEKDMQQRSQRLTELEAKFERKLLEGPKVQVNQGPASFPWPEALKPFAGKLEAFGIKTIQTFAEKLMGSDWISNALRAAVTQNPDFLTLWNDVERRNAAAQSIIDALPGGVGENLIRIIAGAMEKQTGGPQG